MKTSPQWWDDSGAKEIRTPDLCSAIAALYQLSYSPKDREQNISLCVALQMQERTV